MITITNEDNMQLMSRYPDKHFDLAIVDPPYGIGVAKNGYSTLATGGNHLAKRSSLRIDPKAQSLSLI